jgi:tetratricopeptide (TPR) repeat protein
MANLHIINFIQGLSQVEIRLVEEYLNKSHSLFSSDELMEVKLFKYIINNKNEIVTDEIIIRETGTKRVTDLKNNLFSKVLESLTLDKYLKNTELFTEADILTFELKKKLLICRVSIRTANQKKTKTIEELLNEIIEVAKTNEFYDIIVEALIQKKYFSGSRLGLADFEKINNELSFYDYSHKALLSAADSLHRLIFNNYFIKAFTKAEIDKQIETAIKQINIDYKKTQSIHINYYLMIMHYALSERKKDYKGAIKYCNKVIELLEKNKIIYRKERMGFVFDNLSQFQTYLGEYIKAAKSSQKAQKYYLENSYNSMISKQQEFFTNFYSGNFNDANKCLTGLLNHSTIDTGEFRKSKFIYYLACVHFAESNYKQALALLNESLEIEKDKTRWNISLRILNIMIFIELNKIDEAFSSLESLRKYMERTGKQDEVSQRDVLIVKLLREMQKEGFEFDSKNPVTNKMLKQLTEKDSETSWEYFSSELIPFHEWIKKKYKV